MALNCGGETESTVHHEMLHAIGVHHEHVRPDRDDVLNVDTSGVDPNMAHNWEKVRLPISILIRWPIKIIIDHFR